MNSLPHQVLLVEDDQKLPEVLAVLLHDSNIHLHHAPSVADALALLREKQIELVLLDLGLPEVNGFELLRMMKESADMRSIPVIVLTAWNSTKDKLRGFEMGAVDYLTKPFESAELRARVCAALRTKRLQDELTQTNQDLMTARIAAETAARTKAEFLANMSHEIRTPMNGVIAMAGLLLETPVSNDQRGYIETIHSSGEALLTIINDILDFSKIESGRLELEHLPFDLRSCIEESLDLLASKAAEKSLDLAYQMEDSVPPMILGDVTRLRQVLVNLVSNAVKFTDKGEVVVQVRTLGSPPAGETPSKPWHLHFSVRDTGIGIPVDRLARLFQPFTQADVSTSRHYGGTGLGLTISKRLVELMGGKVWVESVADAGSTFHFTVWFQAATPSTQSPIEGTQPQLANLRLLIVDDNATNCRILSLQTSKWGMIPRGASSAKQALEWLNAGENFDLAILDMQMPGMDGLALASEMRKLPGTMMIPLVLLTSMGVRTDEPGFSQAAFSSCLIKPIKPVQLHETLVRVISGAKPAKKAAGLPKLDPKLASRLPLRVLLCDDNVVNQKVALRLLQQMGYKADIAVNGVQALKALEKQSYDLVFMDVMMPEMDGLEATRAIRERQKDRARYPTFKSPIIIVAMTANAMQGDRGKCLAAGMDDYLPKPVRLEDIRAIVERWGSSAGMSEPGDTTAAAPGAPQTQSAPPPPAADGPPVDMERLNELTDGNNDSLRELVTLYVKQTAGQMVELDAAVRANDAEAVRRVAHSCAGASSTCGIKNLPPLLRELERQGHEGKLTSAPELCRQVIAEFERVKQFLAPHDDAQAGARVTDDDMKKILIIEDDQIVANIYRNKLIHEGYQIELAHDGEEGFKNVGIFRPDVVVLDLMLPKISGIDLIKKIRGEAGFEKTPVVVFSNTYLTNLVQEAWKAGATKCLSKANCTPRQLIDVIRSVVDAAESSSASAAPATPQPVRQPEPQPATIQSDAEFQANLLKPFVQALPAVLGELRASLKTISKADSEAARVKEAGELYKRVHTLTGSAGISGMAQIALVCDALEALLKELGDKPQNINASTIRTLASTIDFLGFLFDRTARTMDKQEIPPARVLVVDDEAVSRRAIVTALDKAKLKSTDVEDPNHAFKLLTEGRYDLVFLDVDMPGMNGFELCTKLRALPAYKSIPVVFVTSLTDFESRASSMMSGGNDFIAKPFLLMELAVKALVYVLRSKLAAAGK